MSSQAVSQFQVKFCLVRRGPPALTTPSQRTAPHPSVNTQVLSELVVSCPGVVLLNLRITCRQFSFPRTPRHTHDQHIRSTKSQSRTVNAYMINVSRHSTGISEQLWRTNATNGIRGLADTLRGTHLNRPPRPTHAHAHAITASAHGSEPSRWLRQHFLSAGSGLHNHMHD